jgi:signal transduction histidine kinase
MVAWRDRLADVAIAVAVAVAVQIALVAATEPGSRPLTWVGYGLGGLMAVPFLGVRRWPVAVNYLVSAVLLAYFWIGFPGFPPTLVLLAPVYFGAERGKLWLVLPAPVLFFGAALLVSIRKGQTPLELLNGLLPHAALIAVAALLGTLVRTRQALASRRVTEERLRIARELHDTVSHALSTIAVQAGAALQVADRRPDLVREALAAIRSTGRDTLEELRAALGLLRGAGDPVDGSAGLERLANLVDAVRAAGLTVSVRNDAGAPLPSAVDQAAYRIVQEALTNVLRHAGPAATAEVRLLRKSGELMIEVDDDGVGMGADLPVGGHGLAGMRERVAALGGSLQAGPADRGFAVRARLPIGARR